MTKNIATGQTVFLPYRVSELTGEVVSETSRSERNVAIEAVYLNIC